MMVVVTEAAINRISEELEGREPKPIRIYMTKEKGTS
jgi:hypothetical protein